MVTYDPEEEPDRHAWLQAPERDRILAVERWHTLAKLSLPRETAHAVFHVIVENQLAEGLESVSRAIPRLMAEGLSRHDAIHAVGWVLASYIHEMLLAPQATNQRDSVQARYDADVERLTAQAWREQASQ